MYFRDLRFKLTHTDLLTVQDQLNMRVTRQDYVNPSTLSYTVAICLKSCGPQDYVNPSTLSYTVVISLKSCGPQDYVNPSTLPYTVVISLPQLVV